MLKLIPIIVSVDTLLLDPNNPRFVTDLNFKLDVPDADFESHQDTLLGKFNSKADQSEEGDFFRIDDLKESMKEIGYVGIDRIVVRRLPSGKFVVLEGNRRTATIKTLRENNKNALPNDNANKLPEHVSNTFEELEVMELDSEGLSRSELNEKINIILGLRHYGSLLEWEPLPKAYNMYHNYMNIDPVLDEFQIEQTRIKAVASRLSIRQSDVRQALKTYIAYLQLSKNFIGVDPRHYSLIQAAITNKNISGSRYLSIDEGTYQLDEKSQQKLNQLCQFEKRSSLPKTQIIVREPKKFKLLGELVKKSQTGATESVRNYAESLLNQVETGDIDTETGELIMDLDAAVSALNQFEANSLWVTAISQLLEKQANELKIADYKGIGNDLLQKHNVETKLELLRRIFAA